VSRTASHLAKGFKLSGSSVERGIFASFTRTGITRFFWESADSISTRTKSSELSSRRSPDSSAAPSQFLPITAIRTSQRAT